FNQNIRASNLGASRGADATEFRGVYREGINPYAEFLADAAVVEERACEVLEKIRATASTGKVDGWVRVYEELYQSRRPIFVRDLTLNRYEIRTFRPACDALSSELLAFRFQGYRAEVCAWVKLLEKSAPHGIIDPFLTGYQEALQTAR